MTTEPPIMRVLAELFDSMTIAEQDIAAAQVNWPEAKDALHAAFTLLKPSPTLQGKPERLQRAHNAELLARVAKGQDTTLATDAELLMAFSNTSMKAPLDSVGCALMEYLFGRVYGHGAGGKLEPPKAEPERYYMEQLAEARYKLRVKDRAVAKPPTKREAKAKIQPTLI